MEKQLNIYIERAIKEHTTIFGSQTFINNDKFDSNSLPGIVSELMKYVQQSAPKTILCITTKLTQIASRKSFTSKSYTNQFNFCMILLEKTFEILNFDENTKKEMKSSVLKPVFNLAFLPNLPMTSYQYFKTIFRIASKMNFDSIKIALDNITHNPQNDLIPIVLQSMIFTYDKISESMEGMYKLFKKIPENCHEQYSDILEKIISDTIEADSSSFGKDVKYAEDMFDLIVSWGTNFYPTAIAIVFLIPSRINSPKVKVLIKNLNELTSGSCTNLQGMHMLVPAAVCLAAVHSLPAYSKISEVFGPAIAQIVANHIESLAVLPYAPRLFNALPLALIDNESGMLGDILKIMSSTKYPQLFKLLPGIIGRAADAGARDVLVDSIYLIVSHSIEEDTSVASDIFKHSHSIIEPFIRDPNRASLFVSLLKKTEDADLVDTCALGIAKAKESIVPGAIVVLNYACSVIKDRLLKDQTPFVEHLVTFALTMTKLVTYVEKYGEEIKSIFLNDLEVIAVLALPSVNQNICRPALRIFSSISQLIPKESEGNLGSLKDLATAPKKCSVNDYSIRTALLNVSYNSDSFTEGLNALLDYIVSTSSEYKSNGGEHWLNCTTVLLAVTTPLIEKVLIFLIPLFFNEGDPIKRLAACIVLSLQKTAIPMIVMYLEIHAAKIKDVHSLANDAFMSNVIFLLSRAVEQEAWKTQLLTVPDYSLLVKHLIKYANNGSSDQKLQACHLFSHAPTLPTADVRAEFCSLCSEWSNLFMLDPKSAPSAANTMNTLESVANNLHIENNKVIKKCITAAWRAIKDTNAGSSFIGVKLLQGLLESNQVSMLPTLAPLCLDEDVGTASKFIKIASEAIRKSKNVETKRYTADLITTPKAVQLICEAVTLSSNAEIFSILMVHSSIAMNRTPQMLDKMITHELSGVTVETQNTTFRQNGVGSRTVAIYPKYIAPKWVRSLFAPAVYDLIDKVDAGIEFEIDPKKGKTYPENFLWLLEALVKSSLDALRCVPEKISLFLSKLYTQTKKKIGENAFTIINSLFFLRIAMPMLTAPDNMHLSVPITQKTRDILLTASVVLMGAINKGDLNEKKEYYHYYNPFCAKTNKELSKAMQNVLQGKVMILPTETSHYSCEALERPLRNILAVSAEEILPVFERDETPEIKMLAERTRKAIEKPPGVAITPRFSMTANLTGSAEKALQKYITPADRESAGRAFLRMGNVLIITPSRMRMLTPKDAYLQQFVVYVEETKTETSILIDTCGFDVASMLEVSEFVSMWEGLSTVMRERIKEIIIVGATPDVAAEFNKFSESPLKKLITFSERVPDFNQRFGHTFHAFRRRTRSILKSHNSTTAEFEGKTVTLKIGNGFLDAIQDVQHHPFDLSMVISIAQKKHSVDLIYANKTVTFKSIEDQSFISIVLEYATNAYHTHKFHINNLPCDSLVLGAAVAAMGRDGTPLLMAAQEARGIDPINDLKAASQRYATIKPMDVVGILPEMLRICLLFDDITSSRLVSSLSPFVEKAFLDSQTLRLLLHFLTKAGPRTADEIKASLKNALKTAANVKALLVELVGLNSHSLEDLYEAAAAKNRNVASSVLIEMLPQSAAVFALERLVSCDLFDPQCVAALLHRVIAMSVIPSHKRTVRILSLFDRVVRMAGATVGVVPTHEAGEPEEKLRERLAMVVRGLMEGLKGKPVADELRELIEKDQSYRGRLAAEALKN